MWLDSAFQMEYILLFKSHLIDNLMQILLKFYTIYNLSLWPSIFFLGSSQNESTLLILLRFRKSSE